MTVAPHDPAANATTVRPPRVRVGAVESFDSDERLGSIVDASGRSYRFHAVEIVDGSRSIGVGTPVTFELHPRFGLFEAARVTPTVAAPR